jgi:hypothetical protein
MQQEFCSRFWNRRRSRSRRRSQLLDFENDDDEDEQTSYQGMGWIFWYNYARKLISPILLYL